MSQHYERAWLLYQQSRHQAAIEEIQRALAEDPSEPHCHALWALALLGMGQVRAAVAKAEEAVGYGPETPLTHYARSFVMRYVADQRGGVAGRAALNEALRAIDEALRLWPDNAGFFAHRAKLFLDLEDLEAATEAARSGLAVDPESDECLLLLADAARTQGRPAESLALAERALSLAPMSSDAHREAGLALLDLGQAGRARDYLIEALRIDPNDKLARAGVVRALKTRYRWFRALHRLSVISDFEQVSFRPRLIWSLIAIGVVGIIVAPSHLRHVVPVWVALASILLTFGSLVAELILVAVLLRREDEGRYFDREQERNEISVGLGLMPWIVFAPLAIGLGEQPIASASFGLAAAVHALVSVCPAPPSQKRWLWPAWLLCLVLAVAAMIGAVRELGELTVACLIATFGATFLIHIIPPAMNNRPR